MTERDALFAAVIANPREDAPRLVLADWLDEHGEPDRARLIRLQYELEILPPSDPKTSEAKQEAEALLNKYTKEWAGNIAKLVAVFRFRRGFVEWVRVSPEQFLKYGMQLFELAPIREMRFENIGYRMPEVAASACIGRIEMIGFGESYMDQLHYGGRLQALLDSPHLATVRGLDLRMSGLIDEDIRQVVRCPYLSALWHLDLSTNRITTAGLRAVADADTLPALSSLTVHGPRQVSADGVRAIVDSPLSDRLEHLNLAYNGFGDAGVKVLIEAPGLKKLLMLDLSDIGITDAGAVALAESANLTSLQCLTLRGNRKTLTATGRDALKKRFGKDVCVF